MTRPETGEFVAYCCGTRNPGSFDVCGLIDATRFDFQDAEATLAFHQDDVHNGAVMRGYVIPRESLPVLNKVYHS